MRVAIALLCLCVSMVNAQDAPTPKLFVIHFTTGPAWQADKPFAEQRHAQEHSRNLARMRSAGILLVGARYAEKGMIVVRAANQADARAQIEQDPAVQAKIFVYEIAEFAPFYEGCIARAANAKACQGG